MDGVFSIKLTSSLTETVLVVPGEQLYFRGDLLFGGEPSAMGSRRTAMWLVNGQPILTGSLSDYAVMYRGFPLKSGDVVEAMAWTPNVMKAQYATVFLRWVPDPEVDSKGNR